MTPLNYNKKFLKKEIKQYLFFWHLLHTIVYSRCSTNVEGRERKSKKGNRERRSKRREISGQEVGYCPNCRMTELIESRRDSPRRHW